MDRLIQFDTRDPLDATTTFQSNDETVSNYTDKCPVLEQIVKTYSKHVIACNKS